MSASPDSQDLSSTRFLHQHCHGRHGNLNISLTTSMPESSTGEEGEGKDTDFGAVLYIAAVLVFYSLGIVVMIIKYLKTERKEMEEEMALEHFFKGIPSKRIEHSRDEVNRVAIRAFHTLTSAAKKKNQLLAAAQAAKQVTPDGDCDPTTMEIHKPAVSPHSDDSDASRGDGSPCLLNEPSKHLPRVSLIFRDNNRPHDRRKVPDSSRGKRGMTLLHSSLPSPGQRSPQVVSTPLPENGEAGFCVSVSNEHSDHSNSSLTSPTNSFRSTSDKSTSHTRRHRRRHNSHGETQPHQKDSVMLVEEKEMHGKPGGMGRASKDTAGSSQSSRRHSGSTSMTAASTGISTQPIDIATPTATMYNNPVTCPNTSENNQADRVNLVKNSHTKSANTTQNTRIKCADAVENNQLRSSNTCIEQSVHLLMPYASGSVHSNGSVTPAECPCDGSSAPTNLTSGSPTQVKAVVPEKPGKVITSIPTHVTLSSDQGLVQTIVTHDPSRRSSLLPKTLPLLVSDV